MPLLAAPIAPGGAQTTGASSMSSTPATGQEAWWTGPLLAASPSTLPKGHLYVEPYLYDIRPYAELDADGRRHAVAHEDDFGSLVYVNYGLTDRLTIGAIPRFGYIRTADGPSASSPSVGDISLQAQWRLYSPQPGSPIPTVSINLQEILPTGRFDRLARAADGLGSGVRTTAVGVYTQSYLVMRTKRPLRMRLDLTYDFAGGAPVHDRSVYGTSPGFAGRVRPGNSFIADLGIEYSISRRLVAAFDLWHQRDDSGTLSGGQSGAAGTSTTAVRKTLPGGREWIVAPALEYNWSARFGIIGGVRTVVAGRDETASIAPVAALSAFF